MAMISAKQYIERLKNNVQFAKEIKSARDAGIRKEVLKSSGFNFTRDELYMTCAGLSQGEVDLIAVNYYGAKPGQIDKVKIWNDLSLYGDLFN